MGELINSIGGRRFFITLGCGVATTVLVWFGKISDSVYATVIIATVGAYITGNVAQRAIEKPKQDAAQ